MVHSLSIGRWRKPCAPRFVCKPACTALGFAFCLTTLSTAALTAQAQSAAQATRPDPLNSMASVPALTYQSSFSQYRRLDDSKPISWREANDTVTRIGGWRVYAREAQQPDPAPAAKPVDSTSAAKPTSPASAAPPSEMAKPMPPGHGGHKMP